MGRGEWSEGKVKQEGKERGEEWSDGKGKVQRGGVDRSRVISGVSD